MEYRPPEPGRRGGQGRPGDRNAPRPDRDVPRPQRPEAPRPPRPARPDREVPRPNRADPARLDPRRADPNRIDPKRDPKRADPRRADPRAEARRDPRADPRRAGAAAPGRSARRDRDAPLPPAARPARAEAPAGTRDPVRRPRPERGAARPRAAAAAPTERVAPRARPAARPRPVPEERKGTGRKVFVSLLSATVLATTGYYWRLADSFANDLTTADVLAPLNERPADGAIDILMVGMDSRTDAQGNPLSKEQLAMLNAGKFDGEVNTDTLIMIRIPNDGGKAVGISIPRDSYVDIPGQGKHKINSAYGRAKLDARARLQKEGVSDERKLEVESNKEGAKSLVATISKLTGASIDHYAEVNLLGFFDITNAIGGIDVCLNKAVKDTYSGANFPAGPQNLQGAAALAFVRQRHGLTNGDIDRIVRQQVFMGAMAKKVFSQDVLTPGSATLGKLQEAIKKSVVLDDQWDIMRFAQQMMSVTGGNIAFKTIPHGTIDLDTPSDGKAVQIDPQQVRSFMQGLLGGSAPPPAPSSGTTPPSSEASAGKPTVTVLNASGRTGLAAEVADSLTAQGFKTGETGNATTRAKSVVRYATGEKSSADSVAKALGDDITVEPDTKLTKGTVTVLLGKDFTTTSQGDRLARTPALDLGAPARAQQPGPVCVN
ncbi:LCP family protein [Actinokineospora iranica]|uniref:Cell envelope-related function transcriptional attenuator common domain-containing protein n=1 Tax=Actinokineospora iranica TaxID=1271860 RepID=A0A1G6X543_9PSEU|nr:LCP family protein [Actinokineospora iranica]SDD73239.1 cell envelope-related function transcriptional attenuator common domain-containing protein [Actinokineospora iranica]